MHLEMDRPGFGGRKASGGPRSALPAVLDGLRAAPELQDMRLNCGDRVGPVARPFRRLFVKARKQILTDGLPAPLDWRRAGTDVAPEARARDADSLALVRTPFLGMFKLLVEDLLWRCSAAAQRLSLVFPRVGVDDDPQLVIRICAAFRSCWTRLEGLKRAQYCSIAAAPTRLIHGCSNTVILKKTEIP